MESTKKVLLDAQNLWKSYGKGEARVDALADVSLQIFDGELLTILGSSGSGKSTLLNSLGGMDKPDRGKIIVSGKDLCKMNDRALTDYRRISGGQQRRISIARALAKNPQLLLCDEPTGALDYETGKQILVELEKLVRKHGKTVVIVTHTQEIGKMSDRIIKMRNGKITDVIINQNPVSAESIEW